MWDHGSLTPEQDLAMLEEVVSLPAHLRKVLIFYHYGGWTQQEIAKELGVSQSSVNGRIVSALRALRKGLASREEFREYFQEP